MNIFPYAHDIVLLAPLWHAMQDLIALVVKCCKALDLECNVKKTKCMITNPTDKSRMIGSYLIPVHSSV